MPLKKSKASEITDQKVKQSFNNTSSLKKKSFSNKLKEFDLYEQVEQTFSCFSWIHSIYKDKLDVYYSPSILKITGYQPSEIFEMDSFERSLIVPEDIPGVKKQLALLYESNPEHIELNYQILDKSGNRKWLYEQIFVENEKSGKKIIKGYVRDITEQKNKELKLTETIEDLKAQLKARDNFLSVLSHDLRAPFSSILGFTEILLNESSLTDTDKTEYLNYINDSSNNQLRLVNYLLDWSNLQTGRLRLSKSRIQAQSLIFNCISALTGNAIRKNIDIKVNAPESIFIEADERLMIQVITNLVSNAIKFSEGGKTISINVDRFNNEMIEFVVRDEGIGIPEEVRSYIFSFDKIYTTRGTRGEKGTGLGLSLVKEIIERHNGQIWFYSKENRGSEFHFTLPSSENTILLVENNKKEFVQFEKVIKENFPEFKFVGADNGFEAINIVLKHHPSLIISSHDLPLMNGIQLVKSILKGDKKFHAPVIVIIDSHDDQTIRAYREIGVKSLLFKPIEPYIFSREISQALN